MIVYLLVLFVMGSGSSMSYEINIQPHEFVSSSECNNTGLIIVDNGGQYVKYKCIAVTKTKEAHK